MATPKPLVKKTIIKKRTKKFIRHQRRFKGAIPMPSIGYGSDKVTRNVHPNGFKSVVINNPSELEMLMMHNRTYAATIGHAVSSRKRRDIIKRAEQLAIRVTNAKAKLQAEENS
jgi:large subunit ribosomal protein L32e